jgi:hypothetical protein
VIHFSHCYTVASRLSLFATMSQRSPVVSTPATVDAIASYLIAAEADVHL